MQTQNKAHTIQDKNLIESVLYLKKNNLLPESKSQIKFESTKEAEEEKIEEIISAIKEKINEKKSEITELQKAGYNLHFETIKLLEIPLKTKVWKATLAKKDLEIIFNLLSQVQKIITPFKKENEERIAEKERLEKIADQKEREKTQSKPTPTPQPKQPSQSNPPTRNTMPKAT